MEINQKGILLVLSGPSGCGKGTIVSHILKSSQDFALSVSLTTREPRPGEIDGVHYGFVTKEQFQNELASGNMLEYTEYCGNFYGTPEDRVNDLLNKGINVILEIETVGALNVKRLRPDAVLLMILPPSYEVLENRLRARGTNTEEDIILRLNRSKEELKVLNEYHYCVINQSGESNIAAETVKNIVAAERQKLSRNPHILEHFYS